MHFLIRETLSFNLIYVAACYLVGTGMCHNMVGLLQHYNIDWTGTKLSPCLRIVTCHKKFLCLIFSCLNLLYTKSSKIMPI